MKGMVQREEFIGTIIGMKGLQVIVQREDGTEFRCSGKDVHRQLGWLRVPIGQQVKVSRDTNTQNNRAKILGFV
jgi:hypothetical protein